MKTLLKCSVFVFVLTLLCSGMTMAADQERKQDRIKDQKKDGSCKVIVIEHDNHLLAADQDRDKDQLKDQKKDGSCNMTTEKMTNLMAATQQRKQDRTQDRKRDGSCQS